MDRGRHRAGHREPSYDGVCLTLAVEDGDLKAKIQLPRYAEDNLKERYMTEAEEVEIFKQIADRSKLAQHDPTKTTTAWEREYIEHLGLFLLDTGFRISEAFKFSVIDGCADLANGTTKSSGGNRADGRFKERDSPDYNIETIDTLIQIF